jgi:subtilisin family serine protease
LRRTAAQCLPSHLDVRRLLLLSLGLLLALGTASAEGGAPASAPGGEVEVVVRLAQPPLADAFLADRTLAAATRTHHRLDLRAPASVSYVRELVTAQDTVATRVTAAIPGATIRWHYRIVADGMAVVVPRSQLGRLARVPGVVQVYPTVRYRPLLDRSPQLIGAPALWGPSLQTAGNGMRIGIIDEGVDQTHPFFSPVGYTAPPGYPKGDTRYTTAKVIVARAFPPPSPSWKYASLPFDPINSEHGTHVAGIAAGERGTYVGRTLSGVAPNAYIGNYKALTIPTPDFGLDGNSPEIAAAIEAAVSDGMDVINLSLGEPEVDPARDLVVQAIDAAADAGVVPVVAAGNDFEDFGKGSISSPGSALGAITVAAVTNGRGGQPPDGIADFSSAGPTPLSLRLKPDVSAPGVNVLSSLPKRDGLWGTLSGTSMATPEVAGAAALLKERHPTWTVAQIKSALTLTGDPVHPLGTTTGEVPTTREGGGLVDLARANTPLLFATPSILSFGLVPVGSGTSQAVALTDAGGGAGTWTASAQLQSPVPGITVSVPPTVAVPGTLPVTVTAAADATEEDVTGFVVLSNGTDTRRIPFWFRSERPLLKQETAIPLLRTGTYTGSTVGKPALVSTYRYPDPDTTKPLVGPEEVFRVHVVRPIANFGVAVLSGPVTPRIVVGDDENRLAGYTALPLDFNPYRQSYGESTASAAVVAPAAGDYDVVFDTSDGRSPGRFTFRFWVDDRQPPSVRLLSQTSTTVKLALADAGSGVDSTSILATVDGRTMPVGYARGVLRMTLRNVRPGKHTLTVEVADRQEAKNMENVGPILPNTRTFTTTIVVR